MTGITVLGPVTVEDEGAALPPRDRVVLSVLVARRGQEVPAETIAEALWGQRLPASWTKVVQGCVARLRRRLGHTVIVTGPSGYRLEVSSEEIDAGRFERLVRHAHELLTLDHPDQAAWTADEALRLWRGRPLTELEDWEPGRGEAERLTELRLQAEELRLGGLLSSGRPAEVLPEAALRVQEQPIREHRWALLARAQYQAGRQAEALDTLRRARTVLADELGLDPGDELVALERAVLQQDPGLAVPAAPAQTAVCPWPGLEAYDVTDADTFFGRDAELSECLERLRRSGVLAVVGPSGSGKSSLVRAGLAARLRLAGRDARIMTPGPRPLDALGAATAGRRGPGVLVVDQCEEVLARSVPEGARREFLQRICELASGGQAQVVLTLRADRLGELTAYPDLARLVEEGLYLLAPIGTQEVREAIERPARQAGLLLEQGLLDLLVRDVEGEPGSLPLLAHALRQTWERRTGSTLTVAGYHASGEIHGAIARSAEKVYEDATPDQRHALRELLLRMVQPGPSGDPMRTSVPRDAVTDEQHTALVEQLVRARLVTAGADRLEIAHEALARAWPRLQAWLADDVQGERIRHHLAAAASAWEAMGRPESELYRGARLAAAREWRDAGSHTLARVEQEFLAASEEAHRSQLARAEDEARRQRRLNHRLRLLVTGAVVLALVAATLGGLARAQWRDARAANEVALAEADRARAHELAASAVADIARDPARAKSLAVLAAGTAPVGLQVSSALHAALAADPVTTRVSLNRRSGETRLWATLHPDGTRVAMAGESAGEPAPALEVHDARTGDLLWEWTRPQLPGHESAFVAGSSWSADGSVLAHGVVWHPTAASRLGPAEQDSPPPADDLLGIHLRDAQTYRLLDVVDVGPCGGWPLEVSDDVLLVRALTPSTDPSVAPDRGDPVLSGCDWWGGGWGNFLVDRRTGELSLLGVMDPALIQWNVGATLSDDGAVAAVWDQRASESTRGARNDFESTVLFDTRSGEQIARVRHTFPVDLDRSGARVLLRDRDVTDTNARSANTWRVMEVEGQRTVTTFDGHEGRPTYAAFSEDGSTVLSSGLDNVLLQWDAQTGKELRRVQDAGSGRPSTGGGRWALVPRSLTGGAVVVDLHPRGEGWAVPPCDGLGAADQLRVTGGQVVVGRGCGGTAGDLEVLTVSTGERRRLPDVVHNEAFALSPDGRHAVAQGVSAAGEGDQSVLGPLQVHDLATGEPGLVLEGFCDPAAVSRQGVGCASLTDRPFAAHLHTVRWSPDGRWIAGLDASSSHVVVWDASTGALVSATEVLTTDGLYGPWDLTFAPGSDRFVVSTGGAEMFTIDARSGARVGSRTLPAGGGYLSAGVVGHAADGSLVVVTPLRENATTTSLLLLDPATLATRRTFSGVVDGSVRSAAVSPDGTRVALAASEGFVGVWDLASGAFLDRAAPGLGSLEGVQWLDDDELVVLAASGSLATVVLDPDRLSAIVRASLTQGLTRSDCATYGIEPCPDLGSLRGDDPTVPAELRGTFEIRWTAEDLREAAVRHHEDAAGAPLDETALATIDAHARERAGQYRVSFSERGYTITTGEGQEWCTGAVTRSPSRPDRLLLGADRGAGCTAFHFAEVGWEVDGDDLRLPPDRFRGSQVDSVVWTAKALERVG